MSVDTREDTAEEENSDTRVYRLTPKGLLFVLTKFNEELTTDIIAGLTRHASFNIEDDEIPALLLVDGEWRFSCVQAVPEVAHYEGEMRQPRLVNIRLPDFVQQNNLEDAEVA